MKTWLLWLVLLGAGLWVPTVFAAPAAKPGCGPDQCAGGPAPLPAARRWPCAVGDYATLRAGEAPAQVTLRCDLQPERQRGNALGAENALPDRVIVIDRDGDLPQAALDWHSLIDLDSDVWIFDRGGDGKAELIMTFERSELALVAKLYLVQAPFDHVPFDLPDGRFRLSGDPFPSVIVRAKDGWWQRDQHINLNLEITVDGAIDAAYNLRFKLGERLQTDGRPDVTIRLRDPDGDGRASQDWRTVHFYDGLTALGATMPQTYLAVNTRDDEAPLAPVWPWPYLGAPTFGYLTSSPHRVTPPPFQIDWTQGTLMALGEFVSSRGNDAQWFVYAFDELNVCPLEAVTLRTCQPSTPNFESPFGWYDLAGDRDGQAELALRFGYNPPHDPAKLKGQSDQAFNTVRYSWAHNNDSLWDYKVDLAGTYAITSTVTLPDTMLNLLPYAQAPRWVIERHWGPTIFVAAEPPTTGEGIYTWDTPAWLSDGYLAGRENMLQGPPFSSIKLGFRGEYRYLPMMQPWLYFSPIDRKLHLLHAQGGQWNLDDHTLVQYADLDTDGYLDHWLAQDLSPHGVLTPTVVLTEQLYLLPDHLLHVATSQLTLRQVQVAPSLFTSLPPTDRQEWQALGLRLFNQRGLRFAEAEPPALDRRAARLALIDRLIEPPLPAGERPPSLADLRAMLAQFTGPTLTLYGATMSHVQPDGKGFRALLNLQPGFRIFGQDLLGLRDLAPGSYVVRYDQQFVLQALTPPQLSADLRFASAPSFKALPLTLHVTNTGPLDLAPATIELWVTAQAGSTERITTATLRLLVAQPVSHTLRWTPRWSGTWTLTPHVILADGERLVLGSTTLMLPSAPPVPAEVITQATLIQANRPLVAATLATLGFLTAVLLWHIRPRREESHAD